MKILVTGGCGFLGSNIAAFYLEQGDDVVVADAGFRLGAEANLTWLQSKTGRPGQLSHRRLDLADAEAVVNLVRSDGPFDYICHFGGQVAMTTSLSDPRRDLLTNVVGTFNVLEAARNYSPEAFFAYSSTNKVYGDLGHLHYEEKATRYTLPDYPNGLDESTPMDFASPYGCSKGAADQYVRDWFRNFGFKTVVFRHSSIYGGRQFSTFDQGWVGWFCQKAIEQDARIRAGLAPEPFTIAGTGKQVRDVLNAADLVNLYHTAFVRRNAVAGEVFNIGGGHENSLSLLELFHLIEELLPLSAPLIFTRTPRRHSDQDYFVANIGKAARQLGWTPRVSTRQGLTEMCAWGRSLLAQTA
jgi:CDP-paratose 2-epimerase